MALAQLKITALLPSTKVVSNRADVAKVRVRVIGSNGGDAVPPTDVSVQLDASGNGSVVTVVEVPNGVYTPRLQALDADGAVVNSLDLAPQTAVETAMKPTLTGGSAEFI